MNKDINRDWLKLVAGEARGIKWVRIKVRHPHTHSVLFNENLGLLTDDREVTVLDSDNPDSRVVGITLNLADIRSEVTGPLRSAERFLRKLLRLRFKAEIDAYFRIVRDLQIINLPVLQPWHFRPEVAESNTFRRQVEQGYVVVSREVAACGAVAFTLVSAPSDHPITVARNGRGVTVVYVGGRPLKKPDLTPAQAFLFEALSSFGKIIVPATARQPVRTY